MFLNNNLFPVCPKGLLGGGCLVGYKEKVFKNRGSQLLGK